MINPQVFCSFLQEHNISFFAGVPDSLLKNLCAYIDDTFGRSQHVITANEGNAIAMAMGHYLATENPAVAYMQNSGLGNAINPLVSMASQTVCGIPMLLIIGWRGEPGVVDEPQHVKQGEITPDILSLMDIPYVVINPESDFVQECSPVLKTMQKECKPVAILVCKNTFSSFPPKDRSRQEPASPKLMSRESALLTINANLSLQHLVFATTGKTARELNEIQNKQHGSCSAFLTVGAMGHTSSIALGAAMAKPDKTIICLDGDGALLMHMGAMAVIAAQKPENFMHVLLNNKAHESVGGQPTCINSIDVKSLALANGYRHFIRLESENEIAAYWQDAEYNDGPYFIEIIVAVGSRKDLGRPESTPAENKQAFLRHAK